jgi:hypothetical protein
MDETDDEGEVRELEARALQWQMNVPLRRIWSRLGMFDEPRHTPANCEIAVTALAETAAEVVFEASIHFAVSVAETATTEEKAAAAELNDRIEQLFNDKMKTALDRLWEEERRCDEW